MNANPGETEGNPHAPESISPDGALGVALLEHMILATQGRLRDVRWFRTDWQRGGALTGYAEFDSDEGAQPVVVKMPVPPRERRWLKQLSGIGITPRVYAEGVELGGYDFAWVVIERLPHGPLSAQWGGAEFDLLADAAGAFYQATGNADAGAPPRPRDWEHILKAARKNVQNGSVSQDQRWNKALKACKKKLPQWTAKWDARPMHDWCHGDLHLGNAMTRCAPPDGPAVLIDLAETHRGHWVEDAVYLEHLYWGAPHLTGNRKLAKSIADARKQRGLSVGSDWSPYAQVFRYLLAMSTPANLHAEGDHAHVEAALEILERAVA